ncbi:unnamed protein product [Taenia asiatica]|uniref:Uncharacterized protein n=1 Tax=Taenia asiatica TaxID=60517 RepID=A0A0R3VUP7_TAEAS|nr:unnamed protein product [Taenia asiatica]
MGGYNLQRGKHEYDAFFADRSHLRDPATNHHLVISILRSKEEQAQAQEQEEEEEQEQEQEQEQEEEEEEEDRECMSNERSVSSSGGERPHAATTANFLYSTAIEAEVYAVLFTAQQSRPPSD